MLKFPVYMIYLWTFVNIGRPQEMLPFLTKIYPGYIVAALSLGSFLLSRTENKKDEESLWNYKEFKLIMAFIALVFICTPFGYYPGQSVEFLKDFVFKFGLYLFLVMKLITTRERIIGFLVTLIICSAYLGLAVFINPPTDQRLSVTTMYDPNDLAMIMVTILPLTIVPLFMRIRKAIKIFCFATAIIMLFAVIGTQSRGGFIGLIAVAICLMLFRIGDVSRLKRLIPILTLGLVFFFAVGEGYKERIATIGDASDDGSGRLLVWKRAVHIAIAHPILGVGPSAFLTAYGDFLSNNRFPEAISRETTTVGRWQTAHNSYLLILVELGIPGLLLFLAINWRTLWNLRGVARLELKEMPGAEQMGFWAQGLKISVIGFLTCAFFLSQAYNGLIYSFCFVSASMLRVIQVELQMGANLRAGQAEVYGLGQGGSESR